jgi:hypothetical protein
MSATVRSLDGIPIVYDSFGSGDPALVLVHGWSCDRTYWREQTGAFADRYRVVTIDLPGHGESGEGRASWTMAAFGEDVVAVVDDLGLANMVLDNTASGSDRFWREVGGAVLNPVGSLNRLLRGEMTKDFPNPSDRFPGSFVMTGDVGYRHIEGGAAHPDQGIATLTIGYGDPFADAPFTLSTNEGGCCGPAELAPPVVAISPDYADGRARCAHGVETVDPRRQALRDAEDPAQFNRLPAGCSLLGADGSSLTPRRRGCA